MATRVTREDHAAALRDLPVLVVDDDPPSVKLCALVLANAGCKAAVAASAEEALSMLETFPARVVVTDLVLPKMSGYALAQRVKSASADVVVIMMSSASGYEMERRALSVGCAAFLRKPIDVLSFAGVVATHVVGRER